MSKNKVNKTRRDFIKKTAIGAGGITAAGAGMAFTQPIITTVTDPEPTEVVRCDVAVVGGGVAGTYAALRLANVSTDPKTNKKPVLSTQAPRANSPIANFLSDSGQTRLNVKMFEYSGRIGGRLLSTPIQGIPAEDDKSGPLQYAEFGGFRFDRQMKIVWETAHALGLNDEPFYYQDITIENNNIVNVRGDIYTNSGKDSDAYLSYPNMKKSEKEVVAAGFDLGNHITDLAFKKTLPSTNPGLTYPNKHYPNIKSIKTISLPIDFEGDKINYPATQITFIKPFRKGSTALPTVIIPSGTNGWQFAYVRYHYAFNLGDWKTVKMVSDQYERAKKKSKIGGRPFYDWSWWALKRHYLTQSAVDYLEDSSGYNEQGSAGTVETNIDENFYFSVKSYDQNPSAPPPMPQNGFLGDLTYYSAKDPNSVESAWRHISEGYSAIPFKLFDNFKNIEDPNMVQDKAIDVIKNQLIAFTKQPPLIGSNEKFPTYRCLFLKRQQGPALATTGGAALYQYEQNVLILNDRNSTEKEKAAATKILKQYKIVYCRFLILAMPRRSLELINQDNFFFGTPRVQSLLRNSVHNIDAMRMFVAYPRPWWLGTSPYGVKNPAVSESNYYPVGRTRTDLGLRQLYYWCYNKDVNGKPGYYADPNAPAVMLASYTSGVATLYWRALQDGQPYDLLSGSLTTQGHLYNPPAHKSATDGNIRNPQAGGPRHGSQAMGIEAHRQIVELHGMSRHYDTIPLPYYVHYEDWTKDPWGGGWHSWQSQFSKAEYIPIIRQPVPSENVFIIGECYSNVQGWVQGALNAAEAMLQCNLGLPWAPWLSIDGIWLGQGTKWVISSKSDPDPNPCIDEDGQFIGN